MKVTVVLSVYYSRSGSDGPPSPGPGQICIVKFTFQDRLENDPFGALPFPHRINKLATIHVLTGTKPNWSGPNRYRKAPSPVLPHTPPPKGEGLGMRASQDSRTITMRLLKFNFIVASCLSLGLFSAADAHALSVTYAASYDGYADVSGQMIALPQFPPQLGSLLSATFDLAGSMSTSAFASNDGDFYVGWDKTDYELSLAGGPGYAGVAIGFAQPATRIVGTGAANTAFSRSDSLNVVATAPCGSAGCMWTAAGPTVSTASQFTEGASSAFVGSGSLGFLLNTFNGDALYVAGAQTAGLPAANSGVTSHVNANVQVTYNYVSAVPEADADALMLAGFGLVGLMGRRRRVRPAIE